MQNLIFIYIGKKSIYIDMMNRDRIYKNVYLIVQEARLLILDSGNEQLLNLPYDKCILINEDFT